MLFVCRPSVNRTSVYGLCAVCAYEGCLCIVPLCAVNMCVVFLTCICVCVVCLPCVSELFVYRRSVLFMCSQCVAMFVCMPVCFHSHVLSCAVRQCVGCLPFIRVLAL